MMAQITSRLLENPYLVTGELDHWEESRELSEAGKKFFDRYLAETQVPPDEAKELAILHVIRYITRQINAPQYNTNHQPPESITPQAQQNNDSISGWLASSEVPWNPLLAHNQIPEASAIDIAALVTEEQLNLQLSALENHAYNNIPQISVPQKEPHDLIGHAPGGNEESQHLRADHRGGRSPKSGCHSSLENSGTTNKFRESVATSHTPSTESMGAIRNIASVPAVNQSFRKSQNTSLANSGLRTRGNLTYAEALALPKSPVTLSQALSPAGNGGGASVGKQSRFNCDVCSKGFDWEWKLSDHYQTHTGEKKYWCPPCNSRFGRERDLIKHRQSQKHHRKTGIRDTKVGHSLSDFAANDGVPDIGASLHNQGLVPRTETLDSRGVVQAEATVYAISPAPTTPRGHSGKRTFSDINSTEGGDDHMIPNVVSFGAVESPNSCVDWDRKLRNRNKPHTGEGEFWCPPCNSRFRQERDLTKHRQSQKHHKRVRDTKAGHSLSDFTANDGVPNTEASFQDEGLVSRTETLNSRGVVRAKARVHAISPAPTTPKAHSVKETSTDVNSTEGGDEPDLVNFSAIENQNYDPDFLPFTPTLHNLQPCDSIMSLDQFHQDSVSTPQNTHLGWLSYNFTDETLNVDLTELLWPSNHL